MPLLSSIYFGNQSCNGGESPSSNTENNTARTNKRAALFFSKLKLRIAKNHYLSLKGISFSLQQIDYPTIIFLLSSNQ